jgi:glutamate-ammonia-ligase adenylyltransferase
MSTKPTSADAPSDRIDPSRAAAAAARWRRALSESLGQDPGAALDEPRRLLAMLKVFGSTRRLADLCLKHPVFAARALTEGPSQVLAEAARDLTALNGGVGGAELLHAALAPIKNRADLAIAIAEISGAWTASEATAARTDLAERIVEAALQWLLRGAANRGELKIDLDDAGANGVFVLAGGDFAHEDLAPYGPVELLVVYNGAAFDGPAARMAERAFVRIGAELKEALEGRPGDYGLFALKTPRGGGVAGAGVVEAQSRIEKALKDSLNNPFRRWVATARVVAGDRRAGGEFLEAAEPSIWSGPELLGDEARASLLNDADDPRTVFRNAANLLRWSLGRSRLVFRTASARDVFDMAAQSGALPADVAARLGAGAEFAQSLVARAQTMKGAAAFGASAPDEEGALAALCGYADYASLRAVEGGAIADAKNALVRMLEGPRRDFARYQAAERNPDDVDKLEDLGFMNGADLSSKVDGWAALCAASGDARFSSIAPGLLTSFGETQYPDEAVRLFDRLMRNSGDSASQFAALRPAARGGLIDALGCFGGAVEAAIEDEAVRTALFLHPTTIAGAAPAPGANADVDAIARWRKGEIARIAMASAAGEIDFDAAAQGLEHTHRIALEALFEHARAEAGDPSVALFVFDGPGRGLPGFSTPIGIAGDDQDAERREAAAGAYLNSLSALGEGVFAVNPDISHRPGGVSGVLAPDLGMLRSYIQNEAVAQDQMLIARARVIAGGEGARASAGAVLRSGVSNPKRVDVLLRDIDRARAQRQRRDKGGSSWDFVQSEGGLSDVELIISMLIYRHAGAAPALQALSPNDALDLMSRSNVLTPEVAETLKGARAFWTRLATARALARWSDPQQEPVRPRFAKLLARAAEVDSYAQVRPIMRGYADEVSRLYAQLVLGRPSLSLVASA